MSTLPVVVLTISAGWPAVASRKTSLTGLAESISAAPTFHLLRAAAFSASPLNFQPVRSLPLNGFAGASAVRPGTARAADSASASRGEVRDTGAPSGMGGNGGGSESILRPAGRDRQPRAGRRSLRYTVTGRDTDWEGMRCGRASDWWRWWSWR